MFSIFWPPFEVIASVLRTHVTFGDCVDSKIGNTFGITSSGYYECYFSFRKCISCKIHFCSSAVFLSLISILNFGATFLSITSLDQSAEKNLVESIYNQLLWILIMCDF